MEEQQQTFDGPLHTRLEHRVWKARLGAYEELAKLFRELEDDTAPEFAQYGTKNLLIFCNNF
jgi:hypothetical protein